MAQDVVEQIVENIKMDKRLCSNNFGGTKLSVKLSLGVRGEKRLNTTVICHIKIFCTMRSF
jgi:hypothetical protein